MKKFLATVVAFGMVAGVAASASALELQVKGRYIVDGYYVDSAVGNGINPFDTIGGVAAWDTANDWYQHTFRIDPTLIINDKVQMKGDIRLIDSNSVWGSQDDLARSDGEGIRIDKIWLIYDSPIGKIEVGRRPGGAWQYDFVNTGTAADRIMWHMPASGPFKAYAFLQKSTERDAYTQGGATVVDPLNHPHETTTPTSEVDADGPFSSGADNDYYEVAGGYQVDNMKAWLGLGTAQDELSDNNMMRVKGYADLTAGNMTFLSEFDYKFGDKANIDYDSYAFILAMVMNMGNVSTTFGYATISGDDNSMDDENNAYDVAQGTGKDFEPLYILTGNRTNVLNGDRGANLVGSTVRQAGVHALVALADYTVSEDLTLHGGLGWGMADAEPTGWDDDYGWEADLGLAYKLYQNLTYELHFGYWFVGDFANLGGAATTDDIMLLSNHLSMKF